MNKTVCVVSCYKPGYVRGEVLFHAASEVPGYSVIRVANKHRGLLRYPEVIWKTWQVRRHSNPDIYILAFRGYEILPFIRLLSHGRKLIFDDVCIRVAEDMRLEMHIDTDEANAAGIDGGQAVARLLLTKR